MLCHRCRRQVARGASTCGSCGALLAAPAGDEGGDGALELVLDEGSRVPVLGDLLIGRAAGCDLRVEDPSVSRQHARIRVGNGRGPVLEDAGSSHGTFLDGVRVEDAQPLHDGARIQLGNRVLTVQRRRAATEAGRTIVVPAGASLVLRAAGEPDVEPAAERFGARPRLRSGHRVKRLDASEGPRRWVVQDLESGAFLRLDDAEGSLLELVDGAHALPELVAEAERRLGPEGPPRLARLLADLGDRGLLSGIAATQTAPAAAAGGWARRLVGPRERVVPGVGRVIDALYRAGGWVLFTRPALVVVAVVAVAGAIAAGALVVGRYGTPFVVASHLGLGGLVFFLGRGALVAVHEAAHGLALASYGRHVARAGVKLILIFPYAFVDTSESWFEPRRRRIAVSLAGPVTDVTLGGAFAIACLLLPEGTGRDILFQVSFAAYVGAFFNLNPFLDRDGYHVLVDVLGEARLRERGRAELARRIMGRGPGEHSRALTRYAWAGVAWSICAAAFGILLSLRYAPVMEEYAPDAVVWIVLGTLWAALFVPVVVTVGRPLWLRLRG